MDYDDWGVSKDISDWLSQQWRPYTVNRFASYYNAKLGRFNSRFWNPGTEGVDAFTLQWNNEMNWLVPPVYLVPRLIKDMERCKA